MESIEKLPNGFELKERPPCPKLTTDSVALAAFAELGAADRVCDLGAGSGALSVLLAMRHARVRIDAVERNADFAALAEENAAQAAAGGRIAVHRADIRALHEVLEARSFDHVVTNPPYYRAGDGTPAASRDADARGDAALPLYVLCGAAARLLKRGGKCSIVFPAARLVELFETMREAELEPKRMRLIMHTATSYPRLVLAEGRKEAHPSLEVEPPLILYGADGEQTGECRRIYMGL